MPQTKPMTDKRLAYFKARDVVRCWDPMSIDDALKELTDEIEAQKRWAVAAQECNDMTQRHCEEYRKTVCDLNERLRAG